MNDNPPPDIAIDGIDAKRMNDTATELLWKLNGLEINLQIASLLWAAERITSAAIKGSVVKRVLTMKEITQIVDNWVTCYQVNLEAIVNEARAECTRRGLDATKEMPPEEWG